MYSGKKVMKKLTKLVSVLLAISLALSLAACGGNTSSTADGDTIKIGYYGPFTGSNSTTGVATFEGITIAVNQWNERGGLLGKQIELVYYDDAGITEGAVKAVTRLIDNDGVTAIIGSQMSANIMATGEMIEAAGIPQISCGTSATWLEQGWTYLFRSVPENTTGIMPLADAMEATGATKIAVLVSKDEASIGSSNKTIEELQSRGTIEVTAREECNADDTDWTGQLSAMLATKPDGVYLAILGEYAGMVIRQLRGMGYTGYIYGHEVMSLDQIREIAGSGADGIVFFSTFARPAEIENCNTEYERAFWEAYSKEYNENIPTNDNSYKGYDEANIMFTAIKNAGSTDGAAIRDALSQISGLECLAGTANYAAFDNGNGFEAMNIYIIHEGKIVLLDNFLADNAADTYSSK